MMSASPSDDDLAPTPEPAWIAASDGRHQNRRSDDGHGGRRLRFGALLVTALATAALFACTSDDAAEPDGDTTTTAPEGAGPEASLEERQGGMTTTFVDDSTAFARSARSLANDDRRRFGQGDAVFEADFAPPGEEGEFTGLGERFDTTGCTSCHVNDGRANGTEGDGPLPEGFVVKVDTEDPDVLSTYGTQLQQHRLDETGEAGAGDAAVVVEYTEVDGEYEDGTPFSLRRPTYAVEDGAFEPLPGDAALSVRQAPPLIGLGLLELVRTEDLQQLADPDDVDGNGISGEFGVAHVPFLEHSVIGRFGWQAQAATVEHQTAMALFHDIGITSHWFPAGDCETSPATCPYPDGPVDPEALEYQVDVSGENEPGGEDVALPATELADRDLFTLTVYTQGLAVPAMRNVDDPEVIRGAEVFADIGCSSCHVDNLTTATEGMPGLTEQVISPGTDLLVYDMGEDLADHTVAGDPVQTDWRTPPLWGIGLAELIGENPTYLHDGRARTVEEAILWHGGEAFPARERFRALSAKDREAVLEYLASR